MAEEEQPLVVKDYLEHVTLRWKTSEAFAQHYINQLDEARSVYHHSASIIKAQVASYARLWRSFYHRLAGVLEVKLLEENTIPETKVSQVEDTLTNITIPVTSNPISSKLSYDTICADSFEGRPQTTGLENFAFARLEHQLNRCFKERVCIPNDIYPI